MFQCQLPLRGRGVCLHRVCGGHRALLLSHHTAGQITGGSQLGKNTKKYFSVRDHAAEDALPGRGRVQGPDHLAHGLAPQQRAVPGRELRVV